MEPTPRPDAATVYLYIDEAGNLDFSEHGTRFFALTGVVMRRPFRHLSGLLDAKYDALEAGLDLESTSTRPRTARSCAIGCSIAWSLTWATWPPTRSSSTSVR